MRKIIFLDIDGVLNSIDYFKQTKHCKGYSEINPEKVKLLKEIVDRTGAEIVLSSTWRDLGKRKDEPEHPMYRYLTDTLQEYGLKIMEHTPYIEQDRPKEIKEWLAAQSDKDIRFVSLDDDYPEHKYDEVGIGDCLVKTSFYEEDGGLRREHVEKAVDILNCIHFDYSPYNVREACKILLEELLKHEELYDGFKASIVSAINDAPNYTPTEEISERILKRIIGEE